MKEIIKQGLRSLLMHSLRTFLSVLGVLFGVVSVITMLSIGEGSKREILSQIEQLGTHHIILKQNELSEEAQKRALESRSKGLTLQDVSLLKRGISSLENIAALKIVKANIFGATRDISPEVLAITPNLGLVKGLSLSEGRFLTHLDIKNQQLHCILGADVAKALGKQGHVGQMIRIENQLFKVVGVLNNKKWTAGKTKALSARNLNQSILIPTGLEKGLSKGDFNDALSEIIVQIKNTASIEHEVKAIARLMEYAHHGISDYQIIVPQELLNQAMRTQNLFNLVLGSIAAISMLVGGIGIMNIMLASVSERTREIGVRRAIGANQKNIIVQFLVETSILTSIGAFLGILCGIGLAYFIAYIAEWSVVITFFSIAISVGMALAVGLASGVYPAIKAARMDPISALRHL